MNKKILLGLLVTTIISNSHAGKISFYAGLNGSGHNTKATNKLNFDGSRITDPQTYNADVTKSKTTFTGEILAGIEGRKDALYGALEVWYGPGRYSINNVTSSASYKTSFGTRYGGRLKFGASNKNITLYGIVGAGQTEMGLDASNGIYNTPGVLVLSSSGMKNTYVKSYGIGLNANFYEGWNASIEYLHQTYNNWQNLNDNVNPSRNPVGTTNNIIAIDTINFGVKYIFKSWVA